MNDIEHTPDRLTRRDALKTLGATAALLGLGLFAPTGRAAGLESRGQLFALPPLGYGYDALEPHIDARTMEIHHTKHHQAYITAANKVLEGQPKLLALGAQALLANLDQAPEAVRTTLRNNVGGHANHSLFWELLTPGGGRVPTGDFVGAINTSFGSVDELKKQLNDAGAKRFGSGWAWLIAHDGKLSVTSTANQDSPFLEGAVPIIGIDVWEHAYYLNYQNRRADYLTAFWNVLNWDVASNFYDKVHKA